MKLAREMQYVPDNQSVPVQLVEEPVFPLEADEKAGTRRRYRAHERGAGHRDQAGTRWPGL